MIFITAKASSIEIIFFPFFTTGEDSFVLKVSPKSVRCCSTIIAFDVLEKRRPIASVFMLSPLLPRS